MGLACAKSPYASLGGGGTLLPNNMSDFENCDHLREAVAAALSKHEKHFDEGNRILMKMVHEDISRGIPHSVIFARLVVNIVEVDHETVSGLLATLLLKGCENGVKLDEVVKVPDKDVRKN